MNHMVAKQNDDGTWDIEVQQQRKRLVMQIEALKAEGYPNWTFEVLDEMAVC